MVRFVTTWTRSTECPLGIGCFASSTPNARLRHTRTPPGDRHPRLEKCSPP